MRKRGFIRTFVAIELPGEVKKELLEILVELKRLPFSIKWIEPENLHLTLNFLGNVEENKLENLYRAVKDGLVGVSLFVVKPTKIVCFPSFKKPRVIVLRLEGEIEVLEKIQKQIEENLLKAGFEPKVKKAHLTLGRVRQRVKKSERRKLGRKFLNFPFDFKQEFKVSSVTVFKSDLFPQGPVYTKLKEFKLSAQSLSSV